MTATADTPRQSASNTSVPIYGWTCWHCKTFVANGNVHHCPTLLPPVTYLVPSVFLACSIDPAHGIAMTNLAGEPLCAACKAEFEAWLAEKRATDTAPR